MQKHNYNKSILTNYNLQDTLLGGQAFCFDFYNEWFYGFTQNRIIKLKQEKNNLFWQTFPKKDDFDFLQKYLKLNVNYNEILKTISKDSHVINAIKKYPNLRLLNQDFEQTLLSYIISSNNTIKNIRKSVRLLSGKFGRMLKVDDMKFYFFPNTETLAAAKIEDLLECKLGFRAKFFKKAAEHIISQNLNSKIHQMTEHEARENLKIIPGIGDKIADCIMCYSLGFDNVIPIDTWVKKIFTQYYNLDPKIKSEQAREWSNEYFEGLGAWAGQFLFEYIRGFEAKKYILS